MSGVVPADDLPGAPEPVAANNVVPADDLPAPQSAVEQSAVEGQQYEQQQARYGTPTQQVLAGIEGVAKGAFGPLAAASARAMRAGASALGVPESNLSQIAPSPEALRGREEANSVAPTVGILGGLLVPGGQGALLGKAGEAASASLIGEGILRGMSRTAIQLAAENALYQSGDEISDVINQKPGNSFGLAISHVGLAAAIGAGFGAGIGVVNPLWKATFGKYTDELATNFQARMKEHMMNPDRTGTFVDELQAYYKGLKDTFSETFGPEGLKAREIRRLLSADIKTAADLPNESAQSTEPEPNGVHIGPEAGIISRVTKNMRSQMENLNTKAEAAIVAMQEKQVPERYVNKFKNGVQTFQAAATDPAATPISIFNATQDLKQTLQGYSKGNWGPFAVPSYHEAYDFLNETKNLSREIRTGLEDSSVWGKAATRQQAINNAFKEWFPTLKDFEKKFTSEVNGERVIDPGKANTYLNQLGKPNAELKQEMLKNFIDHSEKYKNVIDDSHETLGTESPLNITPTHTMMQTLDKPTAGARLADMFVKHFGGMAGKTLGGAVGGGAGMLTGIPGMGMVGTLLGEHALSPFFSSVLPTLAAPIMDGVASGEGLKAGADYGASVARGMKLQNNAIKSIFKSGIKVLPDSKLPTEDKRKRLDETLQQFQEKPEKIAQVGGAIGHYYPQHAQAIGATVQNAAQFLNSIRPQSRPQAPLDKPLKISTAVQAQYDRALDIAQQPMIVFSAIKDGTLTSHDITALQTLYPDLYAGMKQQVMNQIIEHKAGGGEIPYKTRLGLSLFLQQPLDSTMTPQAVAAAQPAPQQAPAPQQGKKTSQAATSNMLKGAKIDRTAAQAGEAMHSTGKA